MINVGDIVVYGTNGVCRFNGIVQKKTALGVLEYYELEGVRDNTNKMYLPSSFPIESRVRHTMSYDEAVQLIKTVHQEKIISLQTDDERKVTFSNMLKENDCAQTVRVVRSLVALQNERRKNGTKLHSADERLLRLARKMADDELAYSLKIEPDAVYTFIIDNC